MALQLTFSCDSRIFDRVQANNCITQCLFINKKNYEAQRLRILSNIVLIHNEFTESIELCHIN
jgi:hypothetical protein